MALRLLAPAAMLLLYRRVKVVVSALKVGIEGVKTSQCRSLPEEGMLLAPAPHALKFLVAPQNIFDAYYNGLERLVERMVCPCCVKTLAPPSGLLDVWCFCLGLHKLFPFIARIFRLSGGVTFSQVVVERLVAGLSQPEMNR
eukprot:1144421-Pelagomonas_calceolata.AAC.3